MLDSIHKMFLAGVGLAAMTKDKIDEHIKELVEKGKLSEKEGREIADEMLEKSKETGAANASGASDSIKGRCREADCPHREA